MFAFGNLAVQNGNHSRITPFGLGLYLHKMYHNYVYNMYITYIYICTYYDIDIATVIDLSTH